MYIQNLKILTLNILFHFIVTNLFYIHKNFFNELNLI